MSANDRIEELATSCIRCGFCLESCPTFQLTGDESESPRGRIYLSRLAAQGQIEWNETREAINTCLGCRACETACPSGVQYGEIFEHAKSRMPQASTKRILDLLTHPARARIAFGFANVIFGGKVPAAIMQRVTGIKQELLIPHRQQQDSLPPLEKALPSPNNGSVIVLNGCINRVLFARVNEATRRLLNRAGFEVAEIDLECCGALHAHGGFLDEAKRLANKIAKLAGDTPVIVNSAGCGSWLKESLEECCLVYDVCEFLAETTLTSQLAGQSLSVRVAYHDACHLAHGQRVRSAPRELLSAIRHLKLLEITDSDRCCGSAGIYNLQQPERAKRLQQEKIATIHQVQPDLVATGNPGCIAWLQQGLLHLKVLHTVEILEAAFSGLP